MQNIKLVLIDTQQLMKYYAAGENAPINSVLFNEVNIATMPFALSIFTHVDCLHFDC